MSYQLVRFKINKTTYEIATKPGAARKYRDNKLGWDNVLFSDQVYTNFKKGNVAKLRDLQTDFKIENPDEILQKIVREGDLQISAAERKDDMEKHRKAVISFINRNYVDANNFPHPVLRLESIIDEAKVKLDINEKPSKQAEEIVKKLQGKLVFKKSSMEYTLFISHTWSRKATGTIYKHHCTVEKTDWDKEGCKWLLQIPPSEFDSFISELEKLTSGDYSIAPENTDPRENKPVNTDEKKKKNKNKIEID